jgi:hypothetical protein
MAGLTGWFWREGRRICSRRPSELDRLVLALERLEPRNLLAADGFGMMDVLDLAWQPEAVVQEGPAQLPAGGCVGGRSDVQGGLPCEAAPELIFLDRVAEELGEAVDLDTDDAVWRDDGWYCGDWLDPDQVS